MPQSQEKCHCDVQQGWQVSAIIGLKRGLNLFKLSWQKQVSVTFLPKHNKCCNILDKSITFCRTDTNRTPFPKYSVRINVRNMLSSKDGFYTFVSWLLCSMMSTFIILSSPHGAVFICVDAHLNNSWSEWECTVVLQCLSCKIHGEIWLSWWRWYLCTGIFFVFVTALIECGVCVPSNYTGFYIKCNLLRNKEN